MPYDKGVNAIRAQKWDDAIAALQQAIAIDPIPSPNKREEGVFTAEYFPQYYLFIAYLKKGDVVNAKRFYLTRGPLTAKLAAEATANYADLQKAEQKAVLAQNKAKFDELVKTADAALAAKKYDDAIAGYDAANKLLPDDFRNQKLDVRLADARNGKVADQRAEQQRLEQQRQEQLRAEAAAKAHDSARTLAGEGRKLLDAGRLTDARGKFQAAQQQVAGFKEAVDGLAEIQGRERDYAAAKDRADKLYTTKDYVKARDEYVKARALNPEAFDRDKLAATVVSIDQLIGTNALVEAATSAFAQKRWTDAASAATSVLQNQPGNKPMALLRARAESRAALDAAKAFTAAKRFREADAKLADAIAKDSTNREAVEARAANARLMAAAERAAADPDELARRGLLALFNGNPRTAVDALKKAVDGSVNADKNRRAMLYAYLGVAYANLSFQSPPRDADQLKSQALDQFRLARALQPGLKLSDRLVSPRVRELYESRGRPGPEPRAGTRASK